VLDHPVALTVELERIALERGEAVLPHLEGALLERRNAVERTATDEAIEEATTTPPQTTRARLRGAFIKRAKERKRDYTVDWVHLKLNDQAQRTVLCKDPFKSRDDRVERLIASL